MQNARLIEELLTNRKLLKIIKIHKLMVSDAKYRCNLQRQDWKERSVFIFHPIAPVTSCHIVFCRCYQIKSKASKVKQV